MIDNVVFYPSTSRREDEDNMAELKVRKCQRDNRAVSFAVYTSLSSAMWNELFC